MRFSLTRETEEIFAAMIHNCPTLEEVNIFRLLCAPGTITIDALKALPALRCLAIENVPCELFPADGTDFPYFSPRCLRNVNDTIIRDFFSYHVLLDNHSTLQEVHLRYISDLEPETLHTLFKIKSIKSLNFAGFHLLNKLQSFGSVITSTEESLLPSQLETLALELLEINDCDLQFLDRPSITLKALWKLTPPGFQKMMDSAEKLTKITVFESPIQDGEEAQLKDIARRNNIQLKIIR